MLLKRTVTGLFLGRGDEIESLKGVARASSEGTAMGIFISGPRGIGKTELLRQFFVRLSTTQEKVIPFYYSVKPAFPSLRDFSRDYLISFIQQALSFLKKDPSIMSRPAYSTDDLRSLINSTGAQWADELVDEYADIVKRTDDLGVFRYCISIPLRCYLYTGRPVVVMIDDFERLKGVYGGGDCWVHMEDPLNNHHTPHIITGLAGELHYMLFEETSIGRGLELMELKALDSEDAMGLFSSLCRINDLNVIKPPEILGHLNGNPFYIKRFVSAIRHHGNMLHEDHLQKIYHDEIRDGGFSAFWLSHLRRYVPLEFRADSLSLLHHLSSKGPITVDEASSLVNTKDQVLHILRLAGVLEEGFNTIRLIDDRVFVDVVKALHQTEGPRDGIPRHRTGSTGLDVNVPAGGGYEGVVINLLQEIGRRHGIPLEAIGALQVALAELLNSFMADGSTGGVSVRFSPEDNGLTVAVDVPGHRAHLEGPEGEASLRLIKGNVDDIRIETLHGITRVTMVKRFKHNPFTAPTV